MKTYFTTATVTIAATAAILGTAWHQSRVLGVERSRLSSLRQQLDAAASTPPEAKDPKTGGSISSKPTTQPKEVTLDAERVQFIRDMASALLMSYSAELSARRDDAMLEIGAMSIADFRRYIRAVRESGELTDAERKAHCKFAMWALIDRRPADGLTLYTESEDWVGLGIDPRSLASALRRWAAEDLPGGLAWVREATSKYPELVDEEVRQGMIGAAANTDPSLAFSLVDEFQIDPPSNATQGVMGVADTPEKRLKALKALRDYLPQIESKADRSQAGDYTVAVLGRLLAQDGVDAGTKWAESAGLTVSEIWSLGSDIGDDVRPGEEARWIEWFDRKLEDRYCGRPIGHVMAYWAKRDHKAASDWLSFAPDGAAKNAAIARFATTVLDVEPESAAQWAEFLPPGDLRTKTLMDVYCYWPKKSEASRAAARAFAAKHGLEP
ncbi:hypothetical protein OKA04_03400 [Luteolibacter flavescens]|uniref:DUF4034 domain-containing protein n=1 Tax=Luteolibacter flavescens TaxID=1859460 RepID=A0ABT3FKP5_9BACT|nr:hypothetical protein [Luteolibacter flavescens]MCW1883759.1 hypothetical protein [Luteolibacter flavescens]